MQMEGEGRVSCGRARPARNAAPCTAHPARFLRALLLAPVVITIQPSVLNVVARRLEAVVADQQAMVARLGSDEYAILIEAGDSVPDVGAFAALINTELAEPFYLDGIGVAVTATIGVVQHRVAGTNPEELMRAASATLSRMCEPVSVADVSSSRRPAANLGQPPTMGWSA